jgi:hypothetical protein
MVLGDAEEIVTTREIDEETDEEIVRVFITLGNFDLKIDFYF